MLPTSQQTIGPFFPAGFFGSADHDLTRVSDDAPPTTLGEHVILRGTVTRAGGAPCVNAVLEMWQADAAGRFGADPAFLGWGRCRTDAEGHYAFRTVIPGGFTDATGQRAPHANITVMGAGLMRRVLTTVFFPGFDTGADPVMALVPAALRPLLVAEPARRDKGLRTLRFDIRLRGEDETPFFDL